MIAQFHSCSQSAVKMLTVEQRYKNLQAYILLSHIFLEQINIIHLSFGMQVFKYCRYTWLKVNCVISAPNITMLFVFIRLLINRFYFRKYKMTDQKIRRGDDHDRSTASGKQVGEKKNQQLAGNVLACGKKILQHSNCTLLQGAGTSSFIHFSPMFNIKQKPNLLNMSRDWMNVFIVQVWKISKDWPFNLQNQI